MKLTAILFLFIAAAQISPAEDSTNLAERINTLWTNKDYIGIITTLDKALADDPHDLLALYLRQEYYMMVEEDFYDAQASASQVVAEVDSRIANATGSVYNMSKTLANMKPPTNELPRHLINDERMAYRHKEFRDAFPFMTLFTDYCARIEQFGTPNHASQHELPAYAVPDSVSDK